MQSSAGQDLMLREQPLILVVDDEPLILNMAQEILSSEGYQVVTAGDGKQAMQALQTHAFDLVLTDMMMPDMSGMELVQHLRLHHPGTLAILFTGYANYQDAVEAVKLGAFDYLPKPVQPEILRHAIGRALEYQRLVRAQKDLETVFQGAEALGWQAVELVSTTKEAAVLNALRERTLQIEDLKEAGRQFLQAAQELVQVTNSSIFLFDAPRGRFSRLAALGAGSEPESESPGPAPQEVMDYIAANRRPLLVADISRDPRFSILPRRSLYRTGSFMVIPLTGDRFWGVLNLADRTDGRPFAPRDLFVGWLMGRLLVEFLESREREAGGEAFSSLDAFIQEKLPLGVALLDHNLKVLRANPALEEMTGLQGRNAVGLEILPHLGLSRRARANLEEALRLGLMPAGRAKRAAEFRARPLSPLCRRLCPYHQCA